MRLAVLAATVLVAGGASSTRPVTYADNGKTIRVARGSTLALRLGAQRVWNQPRVSTRALELTPVLYFRYPGFQEWTVMARRTGRTTITAVGRKADKPARHFRLTIVVR